MNKLSRALLLVGGLVLALLVGLLIGRSQRATPTADGNAAAVQITTTAPMAPAPTPLPTTAPQPVAVKKVAPDLQVQEDAAAVGMTTREDADQTSGDTAATAAPPPKTAAIAPDDSRPQAN